MSRLHHFFYAMLFVVLFGSIGLFFWSFIDGDVYEIYHKIYIAILLGYVWYISILLFKGEVDKKKFNAYNNEKIAVIVPVFNESIELLAQSIESVNRCEGNKQIFVINDGSTSGATREQMEVLCARNNALLYNFEKNQGKREGLYFAVKNLVSDHDYVVTIDSDTVLDPKALVRLVEPLSDPKIGASTGDVQLLNEKTNILTRMVGAYYWIGINIYKKAQSNMGIVVCCSGCLAAYKTSGIKNIIDEFKNQRFLGENCTHSEDRHLTNLILRDGFNVRYVGEAISYTHTPDTVMGFIKQQQRWKRGFIRESTFTLTYAWRNNKLLFFQILIAELTMPFFALGLMMMMILTIILAPHMFLIAILPAWLIFMLVRFIHMFMLAPKKIPGLIVYMFFYELVLYWQFIYALFTVRNKSWITR